MDDCCQGNQPTHIILSRNRCGTITVTNLVWLKPGGGTSLWARRGCAPVLGSFWPENSGIGVSFYWKISVIGVYFHSEFSGIGGYSKFCNGC